MEVNGVKIATDVSPEREKSAGMPVLYIGGPADGCRIEMETLPDRVQLPVSEDGATTLYRREALRGAAGLYAIYVHHDIPAQDIICTLLEGYRESEEDRARMAAMPG